MAAMHVVVDGSNLATEGRSMPSLRQLDEAVRQFQGEFPDAETIVVVDATFGHRIDGEDRQAFDDAVAHGELVSPPAGAIGRGDAFVLRIAERVGAQVLSNDSFQEFHDEHPWLFDEGRLIGGKPVPGVGWIFTLRTPVRGPRSRAVTRRGRSAPRAAAEAAQAPAKKAAPRRRRSTAMLAAVEAAAAEATEHASGTSGEERPLVPAPGASKGRRRRRGRGGGDPEIKAAIEAATEEAVASPSQAAGGRGGRRRTGTPEQGGLGPEAVNDPLTFLTFIAEHPLGESVSGTVSHFVSHGAMVEVGPMHCYVPLSGLGDPPPKSARAVLHKGEARQFVLVALDPPRRGAQLALPEVATAESSPRRADGPATAATQPDKAGSRRRRPPRDAAAREKSPGETAPATTAPAKRAPAKKAATTNAAATKAATKKAAAKTEAATKKTAAPTKKAVSSKAASPAKKAAAKRAAPAKKAGPTKEASPAKKAAPTKRAVPAKKLPAKKATSKGAPMTKAAQAAKTAQPAKRSAAKSGGRAAEESSPAKKSASVKKSLQKAPEKGRTSHDQRPKNKLTKRGASSR